MFKISGRIRFELEWSTSLLLSITNLCVPTALSNRVHQWIFSSKKKGLRKTQYVFYCTVNLLCF